MWQKPHLSASTTRLLFVLRLLCVAAVAYGFHRQVSEPLFRTSTLARTELRSRVARVEKLNERRYGGTFEFLTMISAVLTISFMAFGLLCTTIRRCQSIHMNLVAMLLPIEAVVTIGFWFMYFFRRDYILTPEAIALGYLEFDPTINICLHLLPFVGLGLDLWAEMDFFQYNIWQAVGIATFGISYFAWILFLYRKNGRWVYQYFAHLTYAQMAALLGIVCCIALIIWLSAVIIRHHYYERKFRQAPMKPLYV